VYYGKKWGGSGPLQPSLNPATGEVLAEVRTATKEDVDKALAASREAYLSWRSVPAPKRGSVLRQIRGAIGDRVDELGALVALEMGKVLSEGKGEVQEIVDEMDLAVRFLLAPFFPSVRRSYPFVRR
jgi:aldehyde dehydrogenase family 7 protein A1